MSKIEYVVVYAHTIVEGFTWVPLILKNKPEHLKGMLNLVGGKLEKGEDIIDGALRELKEETGLEAVAEHTFGPEYMGRIETVHSTIHAVKVPVVQTELKPRVIETEKVDWYCVPYLYGIPNLMPNLRVMIPLMAKGMKKWVILDYDTDWRNSDIHTVTLLTEETDCVTWAAQAWNPLKISVRSVGHFKQEEDE